MLNTLVIFYFPTDGSYMSGISGTTIALYGSFHFEGRKNKVGQVICNRGAAAIINDENTRIRVVLVSYRAGSKYVASHTG
jgi:hypothetical protein